MCPVDQAASVGLDTLIAVAVGGVIGFASALGLEVLKRRWETQDRKERVTRLLEILYEEVEQLGELIDVDLGLVEDNEIGLVIEFGRGGGFYDGKLRSTISRLSENRTIFDSQAKRLLELPGYLPNSLVRFYSRLQVNCGRMLGAIDNGKLAQLQEIRSATLVEVNALKADLREAIDNAAKGT